MSTIPERPMRADARRNRGLILEAARAVFAAAGNGAQMDDVAAQAGVGVGTVYRHFPTKEALMGELVRQKFELFLSHAREALDDPAEPFEAFAGLLRRNAAFMARDAATQHALMSAGEEIWEHAAPVRDKLLDITAELIDRAQQAGTMRADFAAGDVPMLMCGLGAAMAMNAVDFDYERHLELLLDAMRPPR